MYDYSTKDFGDLVLLGNGGHAKSCFEIVSSLSQFATIKIATVVENTRRLTKEQWRELTKKHSGFILGIGQIHSAKNRIDAVSAVRDAGGRFVTLVSPYARVSPHSLIMTGCVVMPNVCINAGVVVGQYCIINTGAIIEHDSSIGCYCHISTGAVVNGDCRVGRNSFLGSNAVLLNQISVCSNTTVGAGSVVTKNIVKPQGVYVGNPATLLRPKTGSDS